MVRERGRIGLGKARAFVGVFVLGAFNGSCASNASTRGSLMLVIDSSLVPGRDFTELRLRVSDANGSFRHERSFVFESRANEGSSQNAGEERLPLTVDLANESWTLEERVVSLTAWRSGSAIFERSARFVMPTEGVRELRLNVDSLCTSPRVDGSAWTVSDNGDAWAKSCGPGETCVAARCVTDHVDASALPAYSIPSGERGCTDLAKCFGTPGSRETLPQRVIMYPVSEAADCAIDVGTLPAGSQFTVAVREHDERGFCGAYGCITLLDRVANPAVDSGWTLAFGRLIVPRALCTQRRELWVKRSDGTSCNEKSSNVPLCAPWARGVPSSQATEPSRFSPVVAGGGDEPRVCARISDDAALCSKADVRARSGRVLTSDPACENADRYAECGAGNGDTSGMIFVRGGAFRMGSTDQSVRDGDASSSEMPAHLESVDDFWIDAREVGMAEFFAWCQSPARDDATCDGIEAAFADCSFCRTSADYAMAYVTWVDANVYCAAQGKRLPTEAEWEFVATGEGRGFEYPWGNEAPDDNRLCWSNGSTFRVAPCARGAFERGATSDGIFDLAGGVFEWTASGVSPSYDDVRVSSARIARGGSWSYEDARAVRARARRGYRPAWRGVNVGFRCAR